MNSKKVLILYDYFDPAYKAGGPIRSLVNLVKLVEKDAQFYILSTNQDHDGTILNVVPDQWINYGERSKVMYLSKENRGYNSIKSIISDTKPEVVYLNGIYSVPFVMYPLWIIRKSNSISTVIAPRGMLQTEALAIKPWKKKMYLSVLKYFFLSTKTNWHVTTEQEKTDLIRFVPSDASIELLGNIPAFGNKSIKPKSTGKKRNIFGTVALVSPMKNFHLVLQALCQISTPIEYRIYGPIKEAGYWDECQQMIDTLPPHIQVIYKGELMPESVPKVIGQLDYYIQPSKSENFGHSIFEAFNQGIPVIISDQTPWKDLKEKQAGWDVDLNCSEGLVKAIEEAIHLDDATYFAFRKGARKVAEQYMSENDFVADYLKLFSK